MKDRAARAIAECKLIAAMSEEPERITRRFLTPPMHDVHAHLRARMELLSMTVHVDAAGNLLGYWQPEGAPAKRLILGSHIDTVPNGGAYDGVLGVVLALEWIELAQEMALPLAIEVIAFSEEEGVRFGVPFLGSRAVAGCFDPAFLALQDADGVTVDAAIRAFGLDPGGMDEAAADANVHGFIEVHIEQGPVLEAEGLSIATVSGIVGQTRLSVEFRGQANHAGTTSMHLRRDALSAAAEWIAQVEALALGTDGLVATVGKLTVEPNVDNVVPGAARASLDVRHARDDARAIAVEALLAKAETIAARRGLSVEWDRILDQPAVPMDEELTTVLAEAIEAAGLPVKQMSSGAGHDAMVMAARMPTAMLFLRSPGGISHHPAEAVLKEDVQAALDVARKFLARIAAEVG
ncbi:MAG: allantoate amidohydrolase [Terracidiphilus sp.]|jgi:allantoate deiminase